MKMELDTGASVSLISEATYTKLGLQSCISRSDTVLRTYSGEQIKCVGNTEVMVKYNFQVLTLPLLIIEGEGPSLFGRNWLKHIQIDWKSIYVLNETKLSTVLTKHQDVFKEGLGKLKEVKAKIYVEPADQPKYFKARSVPYSMKIKVEEELDRLVSLGILQPVQFSEWATPIVPVFKQDHRMRICGDFKVTVNPESKLDRYSIPRIEDLFATLGGGQLFSKLDMSQAYQQIELEDSSKPLTVINTHKGLFQYNRLPFGISSAPAIFQRVMDTLLSDIPGVIVYLDDVLITGKTNEDHMRSLDTVLTRIQEAGLLLKRYKCLFMEKSVTYLGHTIDANGLHPITEKVEAIKEAPRPRNVSQLKSYLGLITYYGRFLPNISLILFPLYRLLRRNTHWRWAVSEEEAFIKSKKCYFHQTYLFILTHHWNLP